MLVSDFARFQLDDGGHDELGCVVRGPQASEEPVHIDRVCEPQHHFFDDPTITKGLR
jgi:hypothetical protein